MKPNIWNVTQAMTTAHKTQVFSGGACNILDENGVLLRNTERDRINDWLTEKGIQFFDPQIHPDTHGVEYDFNIHHPIEMAAREAAKVNLYEVSPRSFGGISSFEIAADHFRRHEPMVLYFSDGQPGHDTIPEHTRMGHPLFKPYAVFDNEIAMRAHYNEFVKNGNNMRRYLMRVANELSSLTVTFGGHVHPDDVVISSERMHATELFKAVVQANSGERVFVSFPASTKRDKTGNPIMSVPENPPEIEMKALLDQYMDEGNSLRRAISELVTISVFVRVVYRQESAIAALEEVLKIVKII